MRDRFVADDGRKEDARGGSIRVRVIYRRSARALVWRH